MGASSEQTEHASSYGQSSLTTGKRSIELHCHKFELIWAQQITNWGTASLKNDSQWHRDLINVRDNNSL